MPNSIYSNFFLQNEIEDQYNSRLDLQRFVRVNNNLVGRPGMQYLVHKYKATDGAEVVTMGNGNTKSITTSYTSETYNIKTVQARWEYYDEEELTDPVAIETGARHLATDMFNTVNGDIMGEFNKATMVIVANTIDFDSFADAQSLFNVENLEGETFFAFVNPVDVAALRKALKGSLQYVEAYARQGYVGTCAGVNIYTSKIAVPGTVCVATMDAVTLFNKSGTEVERNDKNNRSETAANTRLNTVFARKYYVAALTDETKATKIVKGTAAVSSDTTVSASKTYYEAKGLGYVAVEPEDGDNPSTKGWYEITAA